MPRCKQCVNLYAKQRIDLAIPFSGCGKIGHSSTSGSRLYAMFRLLAWLPITLFMIGFASAQETTTLVVFAASSLTDAFLEIETGFEAAHPDVDVAFNFAGSSTLAAQLSQGAPADVFASANLAQMTAVLESNRGTSDPQIFATNRLAIVVPADNPANIQSLADLARPEVKLVVAAPGVPVREYTDQTLRDWAAQPNVDDRFLDSVQSNIVSEERNVRQVVFKIAFGGADAGIVYTTDLTPDLANDLLAIPISDEFNIIASYPIATLTDSSHPEVATAFIHYVLSDSGQTTLKNWGFSPVEQSRTSFLRRLLQLLHAAS